MGGAFTAVFMNINDVMIFDYDALLAHKYAKTAGDSSPLGEMLSDNAIAVMKTTFKWRSKYAATDHCTKRLEYVTG